CQPGDGVARQFVPTAAERTIRPEELADPIGDLAHSPVAGLTHRYPDRVILAVTQSCEVYCRFCFRRETVGASGPLPDADLEAALAYIRRTPAVAEVILTGGDPLSLSPRRIDLILQQLAAIGHVRVVRIHSRVPVVAPERISPALLTALRNHPTVVLVIHTNHPQELTPTARAALARLNEAGLMLLSQTVLLCGVNDDASCLAALFRALIDCRVKPYYLHHCDLARGAGHFRTTIAAGQRIMANLRGQLSGICLPTYVIDIPGGFGKVPVTADYVQRQGSHYLISDHQGREHIYHDPPAVSEGD
ncbi:MAG: lysine-2,3-aminomutase-like protein, partial [Paracoccaceae bacterium]